MEVSKIAERLNIPIEKAEQVKSIIKGNVDPLTVKSVQIWVSECYNMPSRIELKLCAINHILEGYGIEYVETVDDTFNEPQGLSYVNLGDTYINTVIFDHSCNKFKYCSYGDIIESNMNYYL